MRDEFDNEIVHVNSSPLQRDTSFFEAESEQHNGPSPIDIVKSILRRWKMIIIILILILVPGLAFIWMVIEPGYITEGAIEVSTPSPIIFKIQDETFANTETFMRTEAMKIMSPPVLNRAADKLQKKNLSIFGQSPNLLESLQRMVSSGVLKVVAERGTNLIKIVMSGTENNQADGREVVNSIITAYISVRAEVSTQGEYDRLSYLEAQKKVQVEKKRMQESVIRRLAEEYGTTDISARQQSKFEYVAQLQSTLNDLETKRIALEAQKELLKDSKIDTIDPERQIKMRIERINTDPTVQMLTNEITSLERQVIIAKQNLTAENPEMQKLEEIYSAMSQRLTEKRDEMGKQFDQDIMEQMQKISQYKIQDIESEMKSLDVHENRIRKTLEEEDSETRELGQKQLAINDEKEKLNDIKELLETINRRITQLEMEGKRPATITVAYDASSIPAKTKQLQYSLVCIFGALGAGIAVSFLAEKIDPRIRTPKDVLSQVGLAIIGTTSKLDNLSSLQLPSIVSEDYRTIRANLNLLSQTGIPKKLAITSSGMREGKTTFSINFATSLASSGKRILLIDGDLRKPDVAKAMKLEEKAGLQSILEGKNFSDVVCHDCVPNLDVLVSAACGYDPSIACEILNRLSAMKFLEAVSDSYDHIIVDTPPVLAGPDAMMWAKMTDAVIMSSYSGQTVCPEMQEALNRLKKIGVKILGTVLHSVGTDYGYYRYGYDYYTSGQSKKDKRRAANRPLLLNLQDFGTDEKKS